MDLDFKKRAFILMIDLNKFIEVTSKDLEKNQKITEYYFKNKGNVDSEVIREIMEK